MINSMQLYYKNKDYIPLKSIHIWISEISKNNNDIVWGNNLSLILTLETDYSSAKDLCNWMSTFYSTYTHNIEGIIQPKINILRILRQLNERKKFVFLYSDIYELINNTEKVENTFFNALEIERIKFNLIYDDCLPSCVSDNRFFNLITESHILKLININELQVALDLCEKEFNKNKSYIYLFRVYQILSLVKDSHESKKIITGIVKVISQINIDMYNSHEFIRDLTIECSKLGLNELKGHFYKNLKSFYLVQNDDYHLNILDEKIKNSKKTIVSSYRKFNSFKADSNQKTLELEVKKYKRFVLDKYNINLSEKRRIK